MDNDLVKIYGWRRFAVWAGAIVASWAIVFIFVCITMFLLGYI